MPASLGLRDRIIVRGGDEVPVTELARPIARLACIRGEDQSDGKLELLLPIGRPRTSSAAFSPDFWTQSRVIDADGRSRTVLFEERDSCWGLAGDNSHQLSAVHPTALVKAARSFGLTPRLAQELRADFCERLNVARKDALQAADAVAGAHEALNAVKVLVQAMTTETRTRLLG